MYVSFFDMQNENEAEYKATLQRAVGKMMVFSCRAKQETFNVRFSIRLTQDTNRVRYTATQAIPVDFAKAGHALAESIQRLISN